MLRLRRGHFCFSRIQSWKAPSPFWCCEDSLDISAVNKLHPHLDESSPWFLANSPSDSHSTSLVLGCPDQVHVLKRESPACLESNRHKL